MENLFDLFFGLPLHPLIDHVVVIILPLSALGAILLTFFAKYRKNYGFLVLLGMFVSAISAFIAKQSGEALAARVGWPGNHAELGTNLVIVSFVLFVIYLVWFILQKVDKSQVSNLQFLTKITSGLLAISSVTALVLTVLVGHSGASASWEKRINPPTSTTSQTSNSENNSSTQQEAITLSATEVAKHRSEKDCWSIVKGNVYDLTSYIRSHPGGPNRIISICGKDGTQAFSNQHGNQGAPNRTLDSFLIGAIDQTVTSLPSPVSLSVIVGGSGENEGWENEGNENE